MELENNLEDKSVNDSSVEKLTLKDLSKEEKSEYFKTEIISWVKTLAVSFVIVFIINTFFLQIVVVNGTSMQPTLSDGDKLLTNKITSNYKRGDVVVIKNEHTDNLVKRIIATEGETIRIDFQTGDVFIDEQLLEENYIRGRTTSSYGFSGEAVVPAGNVFVMGDNRNASNDSRNSEIGFVDVNNIFGITFFRIFPFDNLGKLD